MTTNPDVLPLPETCDVAIIGAGPSGLAAATHLRERGINSVHVLEREADAGGIPRHCGHPPFGMREFKRLLTGPAYASALSRRARAMGVNIHLKTSVTQIHEGGQLNLTTPDGCRTLKATAVIVCTGVRETPRAPRFVSGQRPLGILTTGALQSMVYLKDTIPCTRPVIIGSELVSFSALLTSRHAHIKQVAMIEQNRRITARWFFRFLPMMLGVPIHLNTSLVSILGKNRVEGVTVKGPDGNIRNIDCDGVIFTGRFTPEASLLRMGHLEIDPATGGPVVDQYGRCSDPVYFATGNLLRPVETAGWSWQEGIDCARTVARFLNGELPDIRTQIRIQRLSPAIRYTVPQVISLPWENDTPRSVQLRFSHPVRGTLTAMNDQGSLWSKPMTRLPERRVLIPFKHIAGLARSEELKIDFTETS